MRQAARVGAVILCCTISVTACDDALTPLASEASIGGRGSQDDCLVMAITRRCDLVRSVTGAASGSDTLPVVRPD